MGLLYQEIMNVPGLSGTWQQRNKDLYNKLGSPLGPYTGSYAQNIMLLNKIKSNDYYKGGLPGAKPVQKPADGSNPLLDSYLKPVTDKVNVGNEVYSQDVMTMDEWKKPFDTWTQNFVDTYVRPEWEQNVYQPAMEEMTRAINQQNQQYGNTGAWRSSMASNNMTSMADKALKEENQMRTEFQDQSLGIRDAMFENLANPLYEANMSKYVTAPWREMDIQKEMQGMDTGSQAWRDFQDSLKSSGINYKSAQNPADAIKGLNDWNPIKDDVGTMRDWTVKPNPYGSMGTGVFNQYLGKSAANPSSGVGLSPQTGSNIYSDYVGNIARMT